MNLKFYLASTLSFVILFFLGLFSGRELGYTILLSKFGQPKEEGMLIFGFFLAAASIASGMFGLVISLILIERLGRKWGKDLNFGSHPVLKLTFLSFLSFLTVLLLLILLYPTKP